MFIDKGEIIRILRDKPLIINTRVVLKINKASKIYKRLLFSGMQEN